MVTVQVNKRYLGLEENYYYGCAKPQKFNCGCYQDIRDEGPKPYGDPDDTSQLKVWHFCRPHGVEIDDAINMYREGNADQEIKEEVQRIIQTIAYYDYNLMTDDEFKKTKEREEDTLKRIAKSLQMTVEQFRRKEWRKKDKYYENRKRRIYPNRSKERRRKEEYEQYLLAVRLNLFAPTKDVNKA
jgi:hypothetical protein